MRDPQKLEKSRKKCRPGERAKVQIAMNISREMGLDGDKFRWLVGRIGGPVENH